MLSSSTNKMLQDWKSRYWRWEPRRIQTYHRPRGPFSRRPLGGNVRCNRDSWWAEECVATVRSWSETSRIVKDLPPGKCQGLEITVPCAFLFWTGHLKNRQKGVLLGLCLLASARWSFHPWPVSFCWLFFFWCLFFELLPVRMGGQAGAHSASGGSGGMNALGGKLVFMHKRGPKTGTKQRSLDNRNKNKQM